MTVTAGWLVAAPAASAVAPYTAAYIDDVGRFSQSADVVDAENGGTFTLEQVLGGVSVYFERPGEYRYRRVHLSPAAGETMVTGTFPAQTEAAPPPGVLRIGVDSCGAGYTGAVTISELSRSSGGAITSLAARWSLDCGHLTSHGEVRYAAAAGYRAARATVAGDPGRRPPGMTGTVTVTVESLGSEALPLGAPALDGHAAYSIVGDTCSGSLLARGETCVVTVQHTPAEAGETATTLTIPDGTSRGARVVRLAGAGVAPPILTVHPASDGFGLSWTSATLHPPATAWRVYRTDVEPAVLVSETAGTSAVYPPPSGSTASFRVAAVTADGELPASATVTATMPADEPTAGPYSAVLDDIAAGPTQENPWTSVHSGDVQVTAAPGVFSLANQWGTRLVTVRSVNGAPITPGTGTAAIESGACLPAVAEVTVHEVAVRADGTPITFAATATCPGGHTEVRYQSSRPFAAVVASGVGPFLPTRLGRVSALQTLTLVNRGVVPVDLGAAHVQDAASDWPISADGCSGTTLAPGAECQLAVAFAPDTPGDRRSLLVVPDGTALGARSTRLTGFATNSPGPVTDVRVVGGSIGRVRLAWTLPPTEQGSLNGVGGIRVFVGSAPSPVWFRTGTSAAASEIDVHGLPPGVTQYVSVAAYNEFGEGPRSAPIRVVAPTRALVHARYDDERQHYSIAVLPASGSTVPLWLDRLSDSRQPTIREANPSLGWPAAVAYSRDVAGQRHIATLNPNVPHSSGGSHTWNASDWDPTYYDPLLLAFVRVAGNGRPDVHLQFDGDGSVPPPRLYTGAVSPSWLPGGRELLVTRLGGTTPWLEVVAADGSYAQKVVGTDRAWRGEVSPDGTQIAFAHFAGSSLTSTIRVVPIGGGAPRTIASPGGYNDNPVWANDGKTVYFEHAALVGDDVGAADLMAAAAGGPVAVVNVTKTPDVNEVEPAVLDSVPAQPTAPVTRVADFTGDRRADVAVYRPLTGTWHIRGLPALTWGLPGDLPVPGDYAGDRRAELAVFRPSNGTWYVRGVGTYRWGAAGDIPVPADYNGDGKIDIAVFRPSTGAWYIRGRAPMAYGRAGDVPVPADYTGDRKADIAVFRPLDGSWHIVGRAPVRFGFGGATDYVPVPADYNGDGRADIAVHNTWAGYWRVLGQGQFPHGAVGDQPIVGDFNGDGRADPTVFRPRNGGWYVRGQFSVAHGRRGDQPA